MIMNKHNITYVGKIFLYLRLMQFWKDGDGVSYHWNYWNPLAWPAIVLIALIAVLYYGLRYTLERHYEFGFGYSKYWKTRLNEREFL